MGQRGPTPKPSKIVELQGNRGKRAKNKSEPKPKKKKLACPKYLDKIARKEWKRIYPELHRLGLLTVVDKPSLEAYCQAYSYMVQAADTIKKEGMFFTTKTGYQQQHPAVGMYNKYAKVMRDFAREFGFTPSARRGISVPEDEEDPMEDFINER